MNKKLFFFILITLISLQIKATNYDTISNTVPRIEFYTYSGKLFLHRDAMKDMGHKPYWGNELRLAFQTTGNRYWQQAYKYPSYGFGFYSGHFNNKIIGNPFAIFAFMDFPFFRNKKFAISYNWGMGLTFNINEFDSVLNPQNIAIGTDLNVYIDFMIKAKYKINTHWEISGGVKFQHFSNGSIKKPNLGLNMASGVIELAYYPFKTINNFKTSNTPPKNKKYEFTNMFAYGINGIGGNNILYKNATFSSVISKNVSFKRNVGIGIDIFYNEYVKTYINNYKAQQLMSYAFILSSDMIANKFRITTQIGAYFFRSAKYSVPVYERVALRYYPIKNMFTNISIKAHGFRAQFIEWGIGFSL